MLEQLETMSLEPVDAELTRKYRENACTFFTQKSKLKLEDGTDIPIPIDDAFEIFRSISFDDAVDGKHFFFFFLQSQKV